VEGGREVSGVKTKQGRLHVTPCTLAEANAFVVAVHRHHGPRIGHIFSLAVTDDSGVIRGVALCGRPVSRMLDRGWTVEVNRLATDGTPNACSALYGAAWRVAREMGYRRAITYILESEPGTSLRASGWRKDADSPGGVWSTTARPAHHKRATFPTEPKQRWVAGAAIDQREIKRPPFVTPIDETDGPLFTVQRED